MTIKEIIKKLDQQRDLLIHTDEPDEDGAIAIGAAIIILEALEEAPQAYLRKMSHPEIILQRRESAPQSHAVLNILLLATKGITIPDPADNPEWIERGRKFREFFEEVRNGAFYHPGRPEDEEEQ